MDKSSRHSLQAAGLMVFVLNFLLMFPALSQFNDSTVLDQTGRKQRFNFTANGVYAILETNLRFETANGLLGLRLNLEDHLGLEKYKIMPVFSGSFNIKNRHNLFGMFYSLPRSSDFQLQKDIEYNGQIINIDTDIHTYFNINALSLGYMYDPILGHKPIIRSTKDSACPVSLVSFFFPLMIFRGPYIPWEDKWTSI